MEARRFYLDTSTRSFVSDPTGLPSIGGAFFREDAENVELYFLKRTSDAATPSQFINYASSSVKLAVGVTAPAALQTTWTSLGTTITASLTSLQTGTSTANSVQRLSFSGRQPVSGSISINIPQTEVDLAELKDSRIFVQEAGQVFDGRTVVIGNSDEIPDGTYFVVDAGRGSFQISQTPNGPPIDFEDSSNPGDCFPGNFSIPNITNVSAGGIRATIAAAGLSRAGRPLLEVSGTYESGFVFEFVDLLGFSAKTNLVVTSTLAAAPALSALVSFNTTEVAAIIAAGQANNCLLEVEVSNNGARQTYQRAAALSPDIIASTSAAPLPIITPASSFNLIAPDSSVWSVTIDDGGILTATKQ
jgi:hypothetical protein